MPKIGHNLPPEIVHELSRLLQGKKFNVACPEFRWSGAIFTWVDSGSTAKIEALLNAGITPPEHALKMIAHILAGGTRGVSNRHVPTRKDVLNVMRDFALANLKAEIKEKLANGELVRPRGKSINEMTADEFNRNTNMFGSVTPSHVEKLKKVRR